jgi:hypothetical protein
MMNDEITEDMRENAAAPQGDELKALLAENEQLKSAIRLSEAERQLTTELTRAGARSPRLMFDAVKGELRFGEDGTVEDAAELIDRLKQSFPEQFGQPAQHSIDAGAGVANRQHLTRASLARMKPAEIAALDWAEVRRVLAG